MINLEKYEKYLLSAVVNVLLDKIKGHLPVASLIIDMPCVHVHTHDVPSQSLQKHTELSELHHKKIF